MVATKVNDTEMTSSPGPTPAASSAKCRALVPEFTPTQCFAPPQYAANACSKAATSLPSTNCEESSTRWMAASISGLMLRYCAFKSRNGTMQRLNSLLVRPVDRAPPSTSMRLPGLLRHADQPNQIG